MGKNSQHISTGKHFKDINKHNIKCTHSGLLFLGGLLVESLDFRFLVFSFPDELFPELFPEELSDCLLL